MSDRKKKTVALCIVTAWVLLFGVCFSEEFGYLQDTPENANQTVEQALSIPVDRAVYISDELPGTPPSKGFIIAALTIHPQAERLAFPILSISERHGPLHGPKLFQFLSTYRI